MRKIIVNGANGYVASHFINELLNKKQEVFAFVRNNGEESSESRMNKVLAGINNLDNFESQNLNVFNYNLNDADYSLSKRQLNDIFKEEGDFFHFAACLKFNVKDQDEIFRTNVEGVENSINLFLNYSKPGSRFFFISSVYSCGIFSDLFGEKFYDNQPIDFFRNYYEQSKRYAENTIKTYIENRNLKAHIFRLSQVVGNNKTGKTITDYGVFDFTKRIENLSNHFPNKTIRIKVDPDSTQNLIPIDSVIDYLMKTQNVSELPVITNFIGKNYTKNDTIIQTINRILPVNLIQDKNIKSEKMNLLERRVAAGMSFTGVYANVNLKFSHKNLDKYFSPDGNEVTGESLNKMMKYFIQDIQSKQKKHISATTA